MRLITTRFMSTTAPSTATSNGSGASSGRSIPSSVPSRHFMASDTDSPTSETEAVRWRGRWSLAPRILAVNVFALLTLASTVIYLDNYRSQLIEERGEQFNSQALVMAAALAATPQADRPRLAAVMGKASGERLRVYDQSGRLTLDSWQHSRPTYKLRDPAN